MRYFCNQRAIINVKNLIPLSATIFFRWSVLLAPICPPRVSTCAPSIRFGSPRAEDAIQFLFTVRITQVPQLNFPPKCLIATLRTLHFFNIMLVPLAQVDPGTQGAQLFEWSTMHCKTTIASLTTRFLTNSSKAGR